MIRPLTSVTLLLAAGAGLYLYQAKHQAQLVDREIERVMKEADASRQRAGVLRAEFALLNDPERLAGLAASHLPHLRATDPKQFATLAELDRRLPPVGPPPEVKPPEAKPSADLLEAAATSPMTPAPVPASSSAARAKPALVAAAVPKIVSARVTLASLPRALPVRAKPGQASPPYQPPQFRDAFSMPAATPSEAVARIARGGAIDPSVPAVASALGMARSLTAPATITPASAATFYPQMTPR